ncbi:hypothetical protein [Xanthomonas sp. 4461]|uniref:hypothetical protein n=1 Tax=Xanthomonas sp. 4461 TaxID=3035313 RepID=UPI002DD63B96|nr:hypothetical protein [Xanthomonas sp. 4461]
MLTEDDVRLIPGNNFTIESAQDTSSEAHSVRQKKSGLTGSSGGGVASVGYSKSRSSRNPSPRSPHRWGRPMATWSSAPATN